MATITLSEQVSGLLLRPDGGSQTEELLLLDVNPHIRLSERDSQLFADLMEAEEEPAEALRQAALEYRQKINR